MGHIRVAVERRDLPGLKLSDYRQEWTVFMSREILGSQCTL
jgi:hypothetical protein